MSQGYYRQPTIHKDQIVFLSEDDLWTVPASGGTAVRLTSNLDQLSYPHFSPDGKWIAFLGKDKGANEVYIMPAEGGEARRLTYAFNLVSNIMGWTPDGKKVLYSSSHGEAFYKMTSICAVSISGGLPEKLDLGHGKHLSYGPKGKSVIGRNTIGAERWKRYKGGTAGKIWIDNTGKGNYKEYTGVSGNFNSPMWIGKRIYFISDHKGIANLYSINPNGTDIKQHSRGKEFYAKTASTDGRSIVYAAGGDIHIHDVRSGKTKAVKIHYPSPRVQRHKKFITASSYFQGYDIHPEGHSLALNIRGKGFTMANWEGAARPLNPEDGVRKRLVRFFHHSDAQLMISEDGVDEILEIYDAEKQTAKKIKGLDFGRAIDIKISPDDAYAAITNHRFELMLVGLKRKSCQIIAKSVTGRIAGFSWSPDSKWITYGDAHSSLGGSIKVYSIASKKVQQITEGDFIDYDPVFSPDGKYIYFLSARNFNPVHDRIYFDYNFPMGMKPYAIALNTEAPNPFLAVAKTPGEEEESPFKKKKKTGKVSVKIDFKNISHRIVEAPVGEGIYESLSVTDSKLLYIYHDVRGTLDNNFYDGSALARGILKVWDFDFQNEKTFINGIANYKLSAKTDTLCYRAANRLRVLSLDIHKKISESKSSDRKSGWVNLNRIKVQVNPAEEWKQIYNEIWRLQKQQFWVKDMSGVDWTKVYKRYLPLVDRLGTRSELSDLAWEMQGELGTSHAYEMGGDYKRGPNNLVGLLGCAFTWDRSKKAYRITEIVHGDNWKTGYQSPLERPGINVSVGDCITAVNGLSLSKRVSPYEALENLSNSEVEITFLQGKKTFTKSIKTIRDEQKLRYRAWVEDRRAYVHAKTKGRIGYVHLPNMGPEGFSEFHRYYATESERDGLIVDVRWNGGGHVSQLILEKLSRKQIGYDIARWSDNVYTYPEHSVNGPMICLTNEFAGSDGDIFSHCFKLMGLGSLVGKRTWGGVIGIWPRHFLIDGSLTTQPEFSFWFKDVGWGVENYGTDPEVDIDIAPQDYKKGKDTQMDKTIELILNDLKKNPPFKPDFSKKPNLKLPT